MNNTLLKSLFLSPEESRNLAEFVAQKRGITDYGNMSNDELSRALKASENKNKTRIDEIREEIKELGHKLSRQELKEIKKNLYEIENKKGCLKSKKTRKYLNKLVKKIYELNKYYDYDDVKYRGIRDIKDLFDLSIGEDCYKPIIVNSTFNNNYIQYESKGDKILTIEEYLSMIESGSGAKHVSNTKLAPQNKQLAEELHKPIIKKFEKRKVHTAFKDNIWGADLADMQLLSRYNKGIRFLLCVIDIFSKYAWFVPLKDKKGVSIVTAYQSILKQSNRKPNKIWVDIGSEFYNASFKKWLQDNDIVMYSTNNEGKAVVAERFIRTLKSKIYKHMTSISKMCILIN